MHHNARLHGNRAPQCVAAGPAAHRFLLLVAHKSAPSCRAYLSQHRTRHSVLLEHPRTHEVYLFINLVHGPITVSPTFLHQFHFVDILLV